MDAGCFVPTWQAGTSGFLRFTEPVGEYYFVPVSNPKVCTCFTFVCGVMINDLLKNVQLLSSLRRYAAVVMSAIVVRLWHYINDIYGSSQTPTKATLVVLLCCCLLRDIMISGYKTPALTVSLCPKGVMNCFWFLFLWPIYPFDSSKGFVTWPTHCFPPVSCVYRSWTLPVGLLLPFIVDHVTKVSKS